MKEIFFIRLFLLNKIFLGQFLNISQRGLDQLENTIHFNRQDNMPIRFM